MIILYLLANFIGLRVCESIYANLKRLQDSGISEQGISTNICYNMDYLLRLQHTIDYPQINKIVEIGFKGWQLTSLINMGNKSYIGYEIFKSLNVNNLPKNVQLRNLTSSKDIKESGDLLIIKDLLMFLPNQQIDYILFNLGIRFKYVLIQFASSNQQHSDTIIGVYRKIKLDFKNGRRLINKFYKSTKKQTWLIKNQ